MKKIVFYLLILIPFVAFTQTVKLSSVYDVDISSIGFMDVVKGPSGYYGAKKGFKFIVIEGVFYSKSTRRVELPLYRMFVKTDTDDYMGLGNPSYVPYSEKDRFIKFKKKSKKAIYFEVDENFKEGILIFDHFGIGKIKLTEDGVTAELIPLVDE